MENLKIDKMGTIEFEGVTYPYREIMCFSAGELEKMRFSTSELSSVLMDDTGFLPKNDEASSVDDNFKGYCDKEHLEINYYEFIDYLYEQGIEEVEPCSASDIPEPKLIKKLIKSLLKEEFFLEADVARKCINLEQFIEYIQDEITSKNKSIALAGALAEP